MTVRSRPVRREEILKEVANQVGVRGIPGTRVSDVADSLGVSTALIFYYFGSRESLLQEAFQFDAERDLAALDRISASTAPPLDRLRQALKLYAPSGRASGWTLWIDGWSVALRDEGLLRIFRDLDRRWKAGLATIIADGVKAGVVKCDNATNAAERITAFLDGLAVQLVVRRNGGRARYARWLDDFVRDELNLDRRVTFLTTAARGR